MGEFWIAFIVFMLSHSLITRTRVRPYLVSLLGERLYLWVYSALSVVLLGWLIVAAQAAPRTLLWEWQPLFYWVPNIVMPFACILFVAGVIVPNPLSILPKERGFIAEKPCLMVALTRHPVLWGFFLWACSHLLPNGEYPLALLFAVFALFSLAGLFIVDRKRRRELGEEEWQRLAGKTCRFLFCSVALYRGEFEVRAQDGLSVILGLLLYVAVFNVHEYLFGVYPSLL